MYLKNTECKIMERCEPKTKLVSLNRILNWNKFVRIRVKEKLCYDITWEVLNLLRLIMIHAMKTTFTLDNIKDQATYGTENTFFLSKNFLEQKWIKPCSILNCCPLCHHQEKIWIIQNKRTIFKSDYFPKKRLIFSLFRFFFCENWKIDR